MTFVSDFKPPAVWKHFDHILTIPRASKDEARMRDYVLQVAQRNSLQHHIDETGNVVVRKPASAGHQGAKATIIQAHLDMVQQNNSDVSHDWARDPITPRLDGEYLNATGTTLGSDNGIGVAAMLALMDAKDLAHGPLELLFTVDEETGLTGAGGLAGDMLEGKQLINVDSEEEGSLTIGCAGGADSHLFLPLTKAPTPPNAKALSLLLAGLRGGHSGLDINLQRGNAVKLLSRALYAAHFVQPFRLQAIEGGNAHNAIPREASATVVLENAADADTLRAAINEEIQAICSEFRVADPNVKLAVDTADLPPAAWDHATTAAVLRLLNALPHGVESMSQDIPGLVETSTNLAVVGEFEDHVRVWMSTRSSVASAMAALRRRIRATARLAGADVREEGGYPGWKPNVDSRLLQVLKDVHKQVAGTVPEVCAVHAGLECGIIGEKYPGMDMISFGPQIEFPHSPDERVKIESVETFYRILTEALAKVA